MTTGVQGSNRGSAPGLRFPAGPARAPALSRRGSNPSVPRWPEGGGCQALRRLRGGDQGTRAGRPRASKWHSARTRDSSPLGLDLRALSAPPPTLPGLLPPPSAGGLWAEACLARFRSASPGVRLATAGRAFSSGRVCRLHFRLPRAPAGAWTLSPTCGGSRPGPHRRDSQNQAPSLLLRTLASRSPRPARRPRLACRRRLLIRPGPAAPVAGRPESRSSPAVTPPRVRLLSPH